MKIAPDVLPPAFYPIGLNVAGRRCVVVGGGDDREANEKAHELLEAGADVVRCTVPAAVTEADLAGAFLVISTPQDPALSAWLRDLADRHRYLLCAIDQPAYGNVAMQAIVKAGPARIAVSTGGISPRVGGIVRAGLQAALDGTFVRFLTCLAHQRRLARTQHAGDAGARRTTMLAAADGFAVDVRVTYPAWFVEECARLAPQPVDTESAP